jgi:hypothetical protein
MKPEVFLRPAGKFWNLILKYAMLRSEFFIFINLSFVAVLFKHELEKDSLNNQTLKWYINMIYTLHNL